MAFLTTNASSIHIMMPAMPRRSLIVVRAAAKPTEHQEPVAKRNYTYVCGRRQALTLLAGGAASTAIVCRSTRADVGKVGGWVEIEDVANPFVQDMGRWAVNVHNATGEKLQFDKVVGCKQQIVAGTNYKLVIETMQPSRFYEAFVFDPLPNSLDKRQLKDFKALYR